MRRPVRRRRTKFWLRPAFILPVGIGLVVWVQTFLRAIGLHLSSLAAVTTIGADGIELLSVFRTAAAPDSTNSRRAPPYERRMVCLSANIQGANFRCSDRIERYVQSKNLTISLAAEMVAGEFPNDCARCKRSDGDGMDRYWRFDSAAPPVVSSGVTHFLRSIPSEARVPPPSKDFNLSAYLAERWERNKDTEFFFEYNPSLVILPEGAVKNLNLPHGEEAAYLVLFRVTSANECFPNEVYEGMSSEQWNAVRSVKKNFVALALMRSDLSMIPGYEIMTDFFVQDGGNPRNRKDVTDYRLFATNDTLYFNINGKPVHMAPFALTSDVGNEGAGISDGGQILPNLYGGGFRVMLLQNLTSIWEGGLNGKNYAMFQTDEIRHDEVLVEVEVSPNHKVNRLRLDEFDMIKLSTVRQAQYPGKEYCCWDTPRHQLKNQFDIDITRRRRNVAVGNESVSKAPERSFSTVDEYYFRKSVFKEFAHGGACCVTIDTIHFGGDIVSNSGHLLVGIGHSKTPWKPWYNRKDVKEEEKRALPPLQYVSFLYAFEPRAPYVVKAKSGYFCLGFGNKEEERINPYFAMARMTKLSLHHNEFDCPKVHYVSSVTEKAGDGTKAIVSYGINDCVPRMVEMDKSEIARFIIEGPADG